MFPRSTDRRYGWQYRPMGVSQPRLADSQEHWHNATDLDMSHGTVGLMKAIDLVCGSKQDRHLDHAGLDGSGSSGDGRGSSRERSGSSSHVEGSKTRSLQTHLRKDRIG